MHSAVSDVFLYHFDRLVVDSKQLNCHLWALTTESCQNVMRDDDDDDDDDDGEIMGFLR